MTYQATNKFSFQISANKKYSQSQVPEDAIASHRQKYDSKKNIDIEKGNKHLFDLSYQDQAELKILNSTVI